MNKNLFLSLSASKNQLLTKKYSRNFHAAFTIVELLIVVVVIAILAAITIVGFRGITTRATEAALKSDLKTAAKVVEADKVLAGTYPADASSANGGKGLVFSGGRVLTYNKTSTGYCADIHPDGNTDLSFKIKSSTNVIEEGVCGPSVAMVSTLAGSGTAGYTDGTGTAAMFYGPAGVAVDNSGNVYVADRANHRIRKVTPSGVVSTLAGSGTAGFADGTGTAAQFNNPYGMAIDVSGNVYVGDASNHRIRKISPAGVTSTLAGSGTAGFADGTGTAAQFNSPGGVAVDNTGNVYVADVGNHRIRKITSIGVVSTLAGSGTLGFADGTGTAAQFKYPGGVAVDASGDVYVGDAYNHRVRRITPLGATSTLAGSDTTGFADGIGTDAQFYTPQGVAVDNSGNVYVSDIDYNRIRKITPSGVVSTLAGSSATGFADGTGTVAQFAVPHGVAVDNSGNVYVGDFNNNRIRKIVQPE